MIDRSTLPALAGVTARPGQERALQELAPADAVWIEIHAEDFMSQAAARPQLETLASKYAVSVHGVGLTIGSENGLDPDHLGRLADVVDACAPAAVSEHLAWSAHGLGRAASPGGGPAGGCLPCAYNDDTSSRVRRHVDQIQERLGRRILLENPSSFIRFSNATMGESAFMRQVAESTGCGLLLDLNNLTVSIANSGCGADAFLEAYPTEFVEEIHLSDRAVSIDAQGRPFFAENSSSRVAPAIWALLRQVLAQTGPAPTLIESAAASPDWTAVGDDVRQANAVLQAHAA